MAAVTNILMIITTIILLPIFLALLGLFGVLAGLVGLTNKFWEVGNRADLGFVRRTMLYLVITTGMIALLVLGGALVMVLREFLPW